MGSRDELESRGGHTFTYRTSNVVAHAPRGGAPRTNVRRARGAIMMEKLKAAALGLVLFCTSRNVSTKCTSHVVLVEPPGVGKKFSYKLKLWVFGFFGHRPFPISLRLASGETCIVPGCTQVVCNLAQYLAQWQVRCHLNQLSRHALVEEKRRKEGM
eukprot:1189466-Rhodomonas_salina.1